MTPKASKPIAMTPIVFWASFEPWLSVLHHRLAIGWKGKKIAVPIVALMVLLSAFIGVNVVSSVHKFT